MLDARQSFVGLRAATFGLAVKVIVRPPSAHSVTQILSGRTERGAAGLRVG